MSTPEVHRYSRPRLRSTNKIPLWQSWQEEEWNTELSEQERKEFEKDFQAFLSLFCEIWFMQPNDLTFFARNCPETITRAMGGKPFFDETMYKTTATGKLLSLRSSFAQDSLNHLLNEVSRPEISTIPWDDKASALPTHVHMSDIYKPPGTQNSRHSATQINPLTGQHSQILSELSNHAPQIRKDPSHTVIPQSLGSNTLHRMLDPHQPMPHTSHPSQTASLAFPSTTSHAQHQSHPVHNLSFGSLPYISEPASSQHLTHANTPFWIGHPSGVGLAPYGPPPYIQPDPFDISQMFLSTPSHGHARTPYPHMNVPATHGSTSSMSGSFQSALAVGHHVPNADSHQSHAAPHVAHPPSYVTPPDNMRTGTAATETPHANTISQIKNNLSILLKRYFLFTHGTERIKVHNHWTKSMLRLEDVIRRDAVRRENLQHDPNGAKPLYTPRLCLGRSIPWPKPSRSIWFSILLLAFKQRLLLNGTHDIQGFTYDHPLTTHGQFQPAFIAHKIYVLFTIVVGTLLDSMDRRGVLALFSYFTADSAGQSVGVTSDTLEQPQITPAALNKDAQYQRRIAHYSESYSNTELCDFVLVLQELLHRRSANLQDKIPLLRDNIYLFIDDLYVHEEYIRRSSRHPRVANVSLIPLARPISPSERRAVDKMTKKLAQYPNIEAYQRDIIEKKRRRDDRYWDAYMQSKVASSKLGTSSTKSSSEATDNLEQYFSSPTVEIPSTTYHHHILPGSAPSKAMLRGSAIAKSFVRPKPAAFDILTSDPMLHIRSRPSTSQSDPNH